MSDFQIFEYDIEPVSTIEDETAKLVDIFDRLISPMRIWRNNNNKVFLIFKSIAAGVNNLRNSVLALKYRFDPRYCSDDDLESAMRIVGEKRIGAKKSIARVVIQNTDSANQQTLLSGDYVFTSEAGELFQGEVLLDTTFNPEEIKVLLFTSENTGKHLIPVEVPTLAVSRVDGASILPEFSFKGLENSGSLGHEEESNYDLRLRILQDTTRQDALKELETALKSLPSIFECNIVFNPTVNNQEVLNGITLLPKELLIIVNGSVGYDFAETVCSRTIYNTHMVQPEYVVNYNNPLFIGGTHPVYYMPFERKPFYLTIHYKYDPIKVDLPIVEATFTEALQKYQYTSQYIEDINEPRLYKDLSTVFIEGARLHKIYIQSSADPNVPSVASVPFARYQLPQLSGITFIPEEIGG